MTFVANARNSGFGFGCNLGAAQASGSYLLFMNPDVIANSKNIRSLIRVLENHPDVALISPSQVNDTNLLRLDHGVLPAREPRRL